jgi:hypothetical protein
MKNETGVALLGDEIELDALSLRGLFVTKAMGDSAVYPGSRTYRQSQQRMHGSNSARTFRHHSRL